MSKLTCQFISKNEKFGNLCFMVKESYNFEDWLKVEKMKKFMDVKYAYNPIRISEFNGSQNAFITMYPDKFADYDFKKKHNYEIEFIIYEYDTTKKNFKIVIQDVKKIDNIHLHNELKKKVDWDDIMNLGISSSNF